MRPTLLLPLLALACAPPPPPEPRCEGGADLVEAAAVVYLDEDPSADWIERDVARVLRALWGEVSVQRAPAGADLHLILDEAAPAEGYTITREGARVVVRARRAPELAFGFHALAEELGARFFHPRQAHLPALGGPRLPANIDLERVPMTPVRGLQPHTLHPVEYLGAFTDPDKLHEAYELIDWLVQTGQNHVQWSLLSGPDFEGLLPYREALLDYAHTRGVTVGAVVKFWGEDALQNQYFIFDNNDPENAGEAAHAAIERGLDRLMLLDFDVVDLTMGEFFGGAPEEVLGWFNHATAYMGDRYPGVELAVQNHVGNYEELYFDFRGEEMFFYHLPGEADPRLISHVHTVFLFDLFRDWGMYEHPNFHLQRDYLLDELSERKVRYLPESAYWVSADIDVPVFLPIFVYARWLDIHGLNEEINARGLPRLDAHVMFTTGHEWGYWMSDYLSARALWMPEVELRPHLDHLAAPFGACEAELGDALDTLIAAQNTFLFDQRLVPYVSGDDLHDDLGYIVGIDTHPPRVPFAELTDMDTDARAAFVTSVLDPLEDAARAHDDAAARFASVCERSPAALSPWCAELVDGAEVTAAKLRHSRALYRAVLAALDGDYAASDALRAEAEDVRAAAAEVIRRREAAYRFGPEVLIDAGENFTRYPFGLLRQAHTQCLWTRQEAQVEILLDTGRAAGPFDLPTCQS